MAKKPRLRVGVIGVGKMGQQHALNLWRFAAKAEFAAVQDLNLSRAESFAESCGSPTVFKSAEGLIASGDVDAVLIAAPDSLHAELVLACVAAGKPVLCEKPLASRPEDALRVLEAESAAGKRLVATGFQRRFDPYHLAVKEAADSGAIGRPLLWKGVHRNARAPYDSSGPFILMNTAGHDIDSARWLLGEEVLSVSVKGLRSREELPEESRDLLLLQMTMSGGRLATAEIFVNADYGYEVSAELVGQKGTATTSQPERLILREASRRGCAVAADWTAPFQDAYLAELNAWVDSALEGAPFPGGSAWDGYVAMRTSEAAGRSLLEDRPCRVELAEKPSIYRS
jgi:myo-inositol 2-dehydrogenase / D-chiro-inositol 1-dehydrogenase